MFTIMNNFIISNFHIKANFNWNAWIIHWWNDDDDVANNDASPTSRS